MVSLEDGKKVPAKFADDFMGTDQDVKDISLSKPETKWALLELPKEQLEALEKGSVFYFQSQDGGTGVDDGGANLCTDDATFSLEFLENSNSQFVACVTEAEGGALVGNGGSSDVAAAEQAGEPQKEQRCEVFGQVRGHLITKPAQVNEQRLRTLLAKQPLGAQPTTDGAPVLSMSDLQYELAASPAELAALLERGPFVEVEGSWRLLPTALEREILDTAVNLVAAKGWDPEDFDGEALLAEVQQHLSEASVPSLPVLRKVLRGLAPGAKPDEAPSSQTAKDSSSSTPQKSSGGTPVKAAAETRLDTPSGDGVAATPAAPTASDPSRLRLDKEKVKSFQVLQVLQTPPSKVRDRFGLSAPEPRPKRARAASGRPAPVEAAAGGGAPLLVEEFATILQELTGAVEKPTAEEVWKAVGSNAYADEFEGTIHSLDVRSLPQDPRERLGRLLELQSHWNQARLAALIAPVLGGGQKVDVWLLKQTRTVFVEITQGKEERFLVKKFAM